MEKSCLPEEVLVAARWRSQPGNAGREYPTDLRPYQKLADHVLGQSGRTLEGL
jgi:hypothetical protein